VTEILLIDDMAGVRRAVVSMLTRAGHQVTAAESGSQAWICFGRATSTW